MLKVLIVDDGPWCAAASCSASTGPRSAVPWSAKPPTAREGLAAAERYSPNLIITDVRMPHMDGIEMMRVLRERGSTAHVIVLTAYNDFDYARSALRFGAADYLLKPFPRPGARRRHRARARRPRPSPAAARRRSAGAAQGRQSKYVLQTRSNTSPRTTPTRTSTSPPSPAPSASARPSEPCVQKETSYTALGYLTLYRIHMARRLLADCR